ncbi:MAG: hypothetical protein IV100_02215 [Myxococcales bacterium]|nr:hypothetical protein [Myxococcales bacterium]
MISYATAPVRDEYRPILQNDLSAVLSWFPKVAEDLPGIRWTWDGRFACVVGVTTVEDLADTDGYLSRQLAFRFDSQSRHVSARQLAYIARFGGVRSGQRGYTDPEGAGPQRFALIWPWTDGVHVSIRLAVA